MGTNYFAIVNFRSGKISKTMYQTLVSIHFNFFINFLLAHATIL